MELIIGNIYTIPIDVFEFWKAEGMLPPFFVPGDALVFNNQEGDVYIFLVAQMDPPVGYHTTTSKIYLNQEQISMLK
jgi:hypothetical protein